MEKNIKNGGGKMNNPFDLDFGLKVHVWRKNVVITLAGVILGKWVKQVKFLCRINLFSLSWQAYIHLQPSHNL